MSISFEGIVIPTCLATVAAGITYWFTNRSKLRDIHLHKIKELNVVLSNMLTIWDHLHKLNLVLNVHEDDQEDLVIPKESVPGILLNSGMLNEKCFEEFEESVKNLKQYDSLTYHRLEGIGEGIDSIRKRFILPFLKAQTKTRETIGMSRHFLEKLIADIEEGLQDVSKKISPTTAREIKVKIADKQRRTLHEVKEEINQDFYFYLLSVMPAQFGELTYDHFKETFTKHEMKACLTQQLSLLSEFDLEVVFEKIAQNPNASTGDLIAELKRFNIDQNAPFKKKQIFPRSG